MACTQGLCPLRGFGTSGERLFLARRSGSDTLDMVGSRGVAVSVAAGRCAAFAHVDAAVVVGANTNSSSNGDVSNGGSSDATVTAVAVVEGGQPSVHFWLNK